MSITRSPLGRRLAVAVAGALALGGVVALAPAANAEQTGAPVAGSGVVTWGISDLLGTTRTGIPSPVQASYDLPSTYDGTTKLSTWGNGSGTVATDGSADLSFSGSSLNWTPTGNAFVKLADVEASFDADGDGEVSAEVSYGTTTAGDLSTAVVRRGPTRVTIVDLYSVDPDPATYPDSLENLNFAFNADADSYDWAGITGRWAPELATFLAGDAGADPAVPGFIYASTFQNGAATGGSTVGVLRWPAEFTFSIDRAEAATTPTASLDDDGVKIDVAGAGFLKTFPGVYLSLREVPDPATPYAGGAVVPDLATAWVSNLASDIGTGDQGAAAAIAEDGSFSTSLLIGPDDVDLLDPAKDYTIVTRKAHGMGGVPSHASQITETPVDLAQIITDAQARKTTTTVATAAQVQAAQDATVNVAVTPAGGGTAQGAVKLLDAEGDQVGTAQDLVNGAASFTVSGLPVGTTTFTVAYEGHPDFWKSAGTVDVTVAKAPAGMVVSGVTSIRYRSAHTYNVEVSGGTSTGIVTVTGGGPTQQLTLSGGKAKFLLPAALPAGNRTLTFAYGGDANTAAKTGTYQVAIRKGTSLPVITLLRAATTKVAGQFRIRVTSPAGGPAPTGKVTVVLTKGALKRTLAARQLSSGVVVITLPKLTSAGLWTLKATYGGGSNHNPSVKTRQFRVR